MQSLHGLMVNFAKEILLEDKQKEKENLNGQMEEYIRKSGKLESSMDFLLRPCRILNRDFCMVQMDCQIRQIKNPAEGGFHVWKYGKLLVKLSEDIDSEQDQKKFPPKFKSERRPFISILNFNNLIMASMPNTYLALVLFYITSKIYNIIISGWFISKKVELLRDIDKIKTHSFQN